MVTMSPEDVTPEEFQSISVRFSLSEHSQIRLAAMRRGMSFNSFVRKVCFMASEKVMIAPSPDEQLQSIVEITELGSPHLRSKVPGKVT